MAETKLIFLWIIRYLFISQTSADYIPDQSKTYRNLQNCPDATNSSHVDDLITGDAVTSVWLEGGHTSVGDQEWVSVSGSTSSFSSDVSVFVSLPNVVGEWANESFPATARVRYVVSSGGMVTFETRLYQANDSHCSKEWHVPESIAPMSLSWMIAEHGAYNISGHYFMVGSGNVTKTDDSVDNANFPRVNFPLGCGGSTTICAYPDGTTVGVTLQLQTVVNDRLLIPRCKVVALRFIRVGLQNHESTDSSYYSIPDAETVSYLTFPTGMSMSCMEKITFETAVYTDLSSEKQPFEFGFSYDVTPAIYGAVGTAVGVEMVAIRPLDSTLTSVNLLLQEDQCVTESTVHGAETVYVMSVGEQVGVESCLVCKAVFSPASSLPTLAPISLPTGIPTSVEVPSPTSSPTSAPSFAPTHAPTSSPTSSPTAVPTVSPTVTHEPTSLACSGISSEATDVADLITGEAVTSVWLEGGYTTVGDQEWVTVSGSTSSFSSDVSVFVSLPNIVGEWANESFPATARVRHVVSSGGMVTFETRLYQANDSHCSKEWHVPESIAPMSLSWMIAEHGAYNISDHYFMVGSGNVTKTDDSVDNANFPRVNFPLGCGGSTTICAYPDGTTVGVTLQLQTVVHDRLLIPRCKVVALRFIRVGLQNHESTDSSYYSIPDAETVSYLTFPTGMSMSCMEKITFETAVYTDLSSEKQPFEFGFSYDVTPAIYGAVGTAVGVEMVAIRPLDSTLTSVNLLLQEDQCVTESTVHGAETVYVMSVGEQVGVESCLVCKAVFSPASSLPTLAPVSLPTGIPTSVEVPSPTSSPTSAPSFAPTHVPTSSPTSSPTAVPTVSPTVTHEPTSLACSGISSEATDVADLITGEAVTSVWLEGGYTTVGDQEWVTVSGSTSSFSSDVSVFVSLPNVVGEWANESFPATARVRHVVSSGGMVTFETRLYQANDSHCSKEWHVPESIAPMSLSWMIAEHGAYNISDHYFMVGSGNVTKTDDSVDNANFPRVNFPLGCGGSTTICAYPDGTTVGVTLQLQTVVHDRLLIPRCKVVALRFIRVGLQNHESTDSSYYSIPDAETVSYLTFPTGMSMSCMEKITFETAVYTDLSSEKQPFEFGFTYDVTPAIYGAVGTAVGVEMVAIRPLDSTLTSVNLLLQEDQCVTESTVHGAETVYVMSVGEQVGVESCLVCKAVFSPASSLPTLAPVSLPTGIPTSVEVPSPTSSPTSAPSFAPTHVPTAVPTVSPTVTHEPTSPACSGISSEATDVADLITGEAVTSVWLEGGHTTVGDQEWVTVSGSTSSFSSDVSVFVSLPNIVGEWANESFPATARVRHVVSSGGMVTFETRLYQANDSHCSKEWHVPESIAPMSLMWMIAEHGAYNISGHYFMVGSGNVTKTDDSVDNANFPRVNFPLGCGGSTTICAYPDGTTVGVTLQLQTVVHDRLLIPRCKVVALRFIRVGLQNHESTDSSYYSIPDAETVSYLTFPTGMSMSCMEKITFETAVYTDLSSEKQPFEFGFTYDVTPAIYGAVGTAVGVEMVAIRPLDSTLTSVNLLLQEDQCVTESTVHGAETVYVMSVGEQVGVESCLVCKAVFSPASSLPTLAPVSLPTGIPTSVPTPSPTSSPTSAPSFAPTHVPTSSPTSSPTAVPTVSPTVTHEPTSLACSGISSEATDVADLITGEAVTSVWLEGGYTTVGDQEWVTVSGSTSSFSSDVSVFVSLPNIVGEWANESFPATARVRHVVSSGGMVTFETRLYQANDSHCNKEWHVPESIAPMSLTWMIAEHGAYNISGHYFMVGSGNVTKTDDSVDNANFPRVNFPLGCGGSTTICAYPDGTTVGVTLQLQTVVHDRLLIPRCKVVALRFIRVGLQNHESTDSSYYSIPDAETVSYLTFPTGMSMSCMEKITFETAVYTDLSSEKQPFEFGFTYDVTPAIYGAVGTAVGVEMVAIRPLDSTLTSVNLLLQEDQCVTESTVHGAETVYVMSVGEQVGVESCLVCKAVFSPASSLPTLAPVSLPTGIPTSVEVPSPTSSPTSAPSFAPTHVPTSSPTSSPTAVPTVSPTVTHEPTSPACSGISSEATDVADLITGEAVTSVWLEGGHTTVGDQEWVTVSGSTSSFSSDVSVFVSLPNIVGEWANESFPATARVRHVVSSGGMVTFETRLYQANDSHCNKEWHVPESIAPMSLTWMIAEHGAYNISGHYFMVGSGNVTKTDDSVDNANFPRVNFPLGCGGSTTICAYPDGTTVGVTLQLQTVMNDRLLIPRCKVVALRFIRVGLQNHESTDSSYYSIPDAETVSYLTFPTGMSMSCMEKITFETAVYTDLSSEKQPFEFGFTYDVTPAIYGAVGTAVGVEMVAIRPLDSTLTSVNLLLQEDQCVTESTVHGAETVYVMSVGEQVGVESCLVCKAVFSPASSLPTLAPVSLPTGIPTSVPTPSPTSSPTSAPSFAPTHVPTSSPTSSPTAVPTVSPTVTHEPTSPACSGISSEATDVADLITGEAVTSVWLEGGYTTVGDQEWVTVSGSTSSFSSDVSVFVSLPNIVGEWANESFPATARVRHVVSSGGMVTFETRLYQANDSHCNKEWHVPESIAPMSLTWMIAEHGAYNISGHYFMVGSGNVTKTDDSVDNANFPRVNFPLGCGGSTTICAYPDGTTVGVTLQLQTVMNDRLLIPRCKVVALRFIRVGLQNHESTDSSYYSIPDAETVSYLTFPTGMSMSCMEKITFETAVYTDLSSEKQPFEFGFTYDVTPAIYGAVGTAVGVEMVAIRPLDSTLTSVNLLLQEDQCVTESTVHGAETVYVMSVGEQVGVESCLVCKAVFSPASSLPTLAPVSLPTGIPTSVPTPSPTSSPTSAPSFAPTHVPTSSPTSSPTAVPTVSPTVTHEPTSPACSGISSEATDVADLITGEAVTSVWLEGGYTTVGDQEWVTVSGSTSSFSSDVSVFVSLPNIVGEWANESFPATARVRHVVSSGGVVTFETRLYQANDSHCSKEWHVPESIAPMSLTWMIAEHGAYNISGHYFMVGSGNVTKTDDSVDNANFPRVNFPLGCGGSTTICAYPDGTTVGVTLQLQTVVNDRLLIPRCKVVALRFIRVGLQNHESTDSSYYSIPDAETVSYLTFPTGMSMSCMEKITFETAVYTDLSSEKQPFEFGFTYDVTPAIYGAVGTAVGVEMVAIRPLDSTLTSVNLLLQEDQCVTESTVHGAETVYVMSVGEQVGVESCLVCKAVFSPASSLPTLAPVSLPTGIPTSVPTPSPTSSPTSAPSFAPTHVPTSSPTSSPTAVPTYAPSISPTHVPTSSPTSSPTAVPTSAPSISPTHVPTSSPTSSPTFSPTSAPSISSTHVPTSSPTSSPTFSPTSAPSVSPTHVPTSSPTSSPTFSPTSAPSVSPTHVPTSSPTSSPTFSPTSAPSFAPAEGPTFIPTPQPTSLLAPAPSYIPTRTPNFAPTALPTSSPTTAPSSARTKVPTSLPSIGPADNLSGTPSAVPTRNPINVLPMMPTHVPTISPTVCPSTPPSASPMITAVGSTISPSLLPSTCPTTEDPTTFPTAPVTSTPTVVGATHLPSCSPTSIHTDDSSIVPSSIPTGNPASVPTFAPTHQPTSFSSALPSSIPSSVPSHSPLASVPTMIPIAFPTVEPSIISTTPSPSNFPSSEPTFSPTSPSSLPTADNAALCELLALTGLSECPSGFPNMTNLCSSSNHGISCDGSDQVVAVNISGQGFTGLLPENIGDLVHCKKLILSGNEIQAPLPASLVSLSNLEVLDISDNNLGSSIVSRKYRKSRHLLDDGGDEVLEIIGQLTNLTYLDISGNDLRGAMPDSLCGLTRLETLYLSSPSYVFSNENNFTCVSPCVYSNPMNINLHYDFTLPYCGQTVSPTVSPTNSVLTKSSTVNDLTASEMGGLIAAVVAFFVLFLCVVYYFTCYSNTKIRKKDEEFMTTSSFIDVDLLRQKHLLSEPSIGRIFEVDSLSGVSESDTDGSEKLQLQSPSSFVMEDEDEMIQAWNEDLLDFQKANRAVLQRYSSPTHGIIANSDDLDCAELRSIALHNNADAKDRYNNCDDSHDETYDDGNMHDESYYIVRDGSENSNADSCYDDYSRSDCYQSGSDVGEDYSPYREGLDYS